MARAATGTTKAPKSGPKARSGGLGGASMKIPQDVDRHVGSRVRMRRMMVGMSQEKLGDSCGITFQQIQKYEKGTNRIGASRLHQIARILEVPVEFFYEGAPSDQGSGETPVGDGNARSMTEFLATSEGLELVKAFTAIKDQKVRRRIVDLARAVAAGEE
jgi:transcriptional regulator with XRE-family HTH domain